VLELWRPTGKLETTSVTTRSIPRLPHTPRGAQPALTFVKDSPAQVDVVIGDARIKLQDEASSGQLQDFDVLVVDAFSGDTIPVHLLTREAMDLYLRHLHSPASVIAFHVSSSTLNLQPVVESLASSYGMANIEVNTAGTTTFGSIWILLARSPAVLRTPDLAESAQPSEATTQIRTWTDDYSSLYDVLHW
jgi:spermidine synthase